MAGTDLLLLPFATDAAGARVLLARIALVCHRPALHIPDHAGQWAPISGEAPPRQPALAAAAAIFAAATDIEIGDPAIAARFRLSPPVVKTLGDSSGRAFIALYWRADPAGLAALAEAIAGKIAAGFSAIGILAAVAVLPLEEALQQLGPAPVPAGGWGRFIVEHVYGGRQPQALDTTFPTLVNQIGARSQDSATPFVLALQALPVVGSG